MLWSSERYPLIIGHRGASATALENTVSAFEAARRAGADGVELDVQRCASGELVVFHDDTLARLAGRPDCVEHTGLAELRRVELEGGERVATLDEAFEAIGGDLLVNLEIKAPRYRFSIAFVHEVARRVRDTLGPRGLVSSFHPGAVFAARRYLPELATGLLFYPEQALPLRKAWSAAVIRPFALHPRHDLVTPRRVRSWKNRGYAVNTWTADHPAEIARLARCGVDAIITNDPAATRRHLSRALSRS